MTSRKDLYLLHPVYHGYIADGFHSDCSMLIQRCLQSDKLNFETFCKIWKEMKFDCLYQERLSGAEIAELSEELIHIGKQYMLADNINFEETVAGIFIVYALINLQPYSGFASLRIVPEDVPKITQIETIARREKRLDVLYILGSILIRGPCQYHAAVREYGMEHSYKKYLQGYSDIDKIGVRSKGIFHSHPEEMSILRDLAGITNRYIEAKEAIAGPSKGHRKMDPSLCFINNNLAMELDESLRKVIVGIGETEQDTTSTSYDLSPQDIKERAMKSSVGKMRHLVGIANRPTKSTQKSKISLESVFVNDADISLTPSLANRKRKASSSQISSKRSRLKRSQSDEDDIFSSDSDDEPELNLKEFHQAANPIGLEVPPESTNEHSHELDIEIDTIPIYIMEDAGKQIEIEFVERNDHQKLDKDKIGECSKICKRNDEDTDVLENVTANEVLAADKKSESFIIKPGKRDQVKRHLKSKFKRMGMLPVANFKDIDSEGNK